ncbi:MAG: HEAT repeat domain-containing protein [Planctomycetota bacterium]|jgi:HEAT repeat protein
MIRWLLALVLLSAAASAHGGLFRPPPGRAPRDPTRPGGGLTPTTPSTRGTPVAEPWQKWWDYNRDHYLRLRQRVRERTVITGPDSGKDLLDRRSVREQIVVPELLKALRDPDEAVRMVAAIAAGRLRARDTVAVLAELHARDKARTVREAAVLGLMLMRDPELRAALRALVGNEQETRRIRGFAVLGLGLLKDLEFLQQLVLLKTKVAGSNTAVDDLRACAAFALGISGAPAVAGPLAGVALDRQAPDPVRGFAAAALARAGTPLVAPEALGMIRNLDGLAQARCGAAIAVGHLVGPAEQGVIDFLGKRAQRDKHGGLRALLFISLGVIGGERATRHILEEMVNTREQTMRGFTALGLGISGATEAGEALLKELGRRKNASERAACALGLGLAGYKESASILREQLKRRHPGFMGYGMVALGLLDDRQAIPLVEDILSRHQDAPTLRQGSIALALLRRSAAVPALLELLQEVKAAPGRASVAYVLGEVGTLAAVQPLLAIYREGRRAGGERAAALSALGRIADPEPISLPARLAYGLNPYVVSDAVEVVTTIP